MGQGFYEEYKKRHGEEPDFYAANYYEAVHVIAELIRRAKAKGGDSWNGARLTEALWEDPSFASVYGGKMRFQKNGVALKRVAILEVVDGTRSDERRVGNECFSQCRTRWSRHNSKKNTKIQI